MSRSCRFVCQSCRHTTKRLRRQYSTRSPTTPEIYDVVTVGGGPVGLALLAALKASPVTSHLRCALIETQDLSKAQNWKLSSDQYSNRASSLTPTNVSFLDDIGAWQHVDQSRVQPYDEMQVWDAANDSSLQFDWRAEGRKYNAPARTVATMTENANLTKGLLDRISELNANDSLITSTSVSSIENGNDDPEGPNLSTWPIVSTSTSNFNQHTSQLAARLLIGADGFNSPVRKFAGIASHGWDYERHGVVATLELSPIQPSTFTDPNSFESFLSNSGDSNTPSNRATAYQRFIPSLGGPIAILPLPSNRASLVWSTTPQNANYIKSLSAEAQVATINAALSLSQADIQYFFSLPTSTTKHEEELIWRTEHTQSTPSITPPTVLSIQPGTVASFPLRFRHTTSLTAPHAALAGDAAHTIHPLAGQGLNLGLADAACLARTIEYAVRHGMDIGDPMTLEKYGKERFGAGLRMAGGVDGLNWLYQLGSGAGLLGDGIMGAVVSRARGLGMRMVGKVPGLKEVIMRQAE